MMEDLVSMRSNGISKNKSFTFDIRDADFSSFDRTQKFMSSNNIMTEAESSNNHSVISPIGDVISKATNNVVGTEEEEDDIVSGPVVTYPTEMISKLFPKCKPKRESHHKKNGFRDNNGINTSNTSTTPCSSASSSATSSPLTLSPSPISSSSSNRWQLIGNIAIPCYDESPRRYKVNGRRQSETNPSLVKMEVRSPGQGSLNNEEDHHHHCRTDSSSSSPLDSPPPYPPPPPPDMLSERLNDIQVNDRSINQLQSKNTMSSPSSHRTRSNGNTKLNSGCHLHLLSFSPVSDDTDTEEQDLESTSQLLLPFSSRSHHQSGDHHNYSSSSTTLQQEVNVNGCVPSPADKVSPMMEVSESRQHLLIHPLRQHHQQQQQQPHQSQLQTKEVSPSP